MSDSCLVLVNIEPAESWEKMLKLAEDHIKTVMDKNGRKEVSRFISYASAKCGIPVQEEKKGFLPGLFHQRMG